MPFKSKAQRRKFAQLLVEGKITPEVFEEWNQETGRATLPERVEKKPAAPRKRKATARKRKATRSRRPATRRSGIARKRPKRKPARKR
jgi:hypothetical protein